MAFDFVSSPALSRLQAKVHEMPLLFAAFATIVYWTAIFYYRGHTRKVIIIAYHFCGTRLNATKHSLNISHL